MILDEFEGSSSGLDDTPQLSGFRRVPAALACLFATTQVGPLSPFDLFAREYIAPNTISTDEESDLASLTIGGRREKMGDTAEANEADAANHTRLELLARQYVNKHLSHEEQARLSIVTERVRRLIPRITAKDFEVLERIAERLQEIGSDDADRRKRLGSS